MRVSPHNLIFPLLASFSITSMGVILMYFLNKKKTDDQDIKNKKVLQNSLEIKIPRHYVPLIIGRSGSVIQNIQSSTCTIITFKEENDIDLLERTCIIIGSNENIKLAEEKIKYILNNQPIIETYETWVPQRTFNNIIDRGGELLNQIQNLSNAKLILDHSYNQANLNINKRVIINGTVEQITNALLLIENKVQEDRQTQVKTEASSFTRAPRIKTSPVKAASDNILMDFEDSKEIFGNEGLMEVFVCAIENPSQFYIQVIGPGNALLDDLVKEMTEYYESEENREHHTLKNITVGQVVAAKFSIDNKWYRAEIIADLDDQEYNVYFVDFGDREKVYKENIFELRTDFLSLRLQAIECCLADVKPRDDEWSTEASVVFSHLSALANWQARIAKIKGYKERVSGFRPSRREGSPIPCIELYEKRDDQLINIGKELIKLDLACEGSDSWSAASSTPSISRRTRSPEDVVIEEIDLTLTPRTKLTNVEVIDLTTPAKNGSSSLSFSEDKRNYPITWSSNNNISNRNSAPRNPFKRTNKTLPRNIIPAGYESELSGDSDDFEMY